MATKTTTRRGTAARGKTKAGASGTRTSARSSRGTRELSDARMTTDPEKIQRWVEERGGYPATVSGTENRGQDAGVLRIDYPGFSGEGTLERIAWEDWFAKFREQDLVFLYQEETKDGGPSRFSKLISRQEADMQRRS